MVDNNPGKACSRPILLDLDGDGVETSELSRSNVFVDAGGDGLKHRTAWAVAGDGVLFFAVGGDGLIKEKREYVFTKWDPTATSDLKALRAAFDTNGDGALSGAALTGLKVMVTNAGGTQTTTLGANGIITVVSKAHDAGGNLSYSITSVTSANGRSITNSYDDNGDGVTDRLQTITITTSIDTDGTRREVLRNLEGNDPATAVLLNRTITTTTADGKSVIIQQDSTGGNWFDQIETRTQSPDGSWENHITNLARDGMTVLSSSTETLNATGRMPIEELDQDGDDDTDTWFRDRDGNGGFETVASGSGCWLKFPHPCTQMAIADLSRLQLDQYQRLCCCGLRENQKRRRQRSD